MADSGYVDLRSDTVTRPTAAMRRAMADAEVGDDLFGDDPTVLRLQEQAAGLTGKQAALYLPTGTLCNQIAMHVLAGPGRVVVCERAAHVGTHEQISSAMLSSITFRTIAGRPHGLLTAAQVAAAVEPVPYDPAVVGLVAVENTHQVGGGTVMPLGALAEIAAVCAGQGVPLYLDGARIFNACAVTGTPVSEYAARARAMMFCLSKGLGAPIGSILAGEASFIEEALRLKILFGAGWRQAGIMAAAGLIALSEGPRRLAEDHRSRGGRRDPARARRLDRGPDQHRVRGRGGNRAAAGHLGRGPGGRGRPGDDRRWQAPHADPLGRGCRRRGHRHSCVPPGRRRIRPRASRAGPLSPSQCRSHGRLPRSRSMS
jgi:threonine aldolase